MIRAFVVLVGIASSITSQQLRLLLPTGATQGQDIKVTCYGTGLKGTNAVVWMRPGIEVTKIASERNDRVTLHLHVPTECEVGTYLFALQTAQGLTRAKAFRVGQLPSVPEHRSDTTATEPQKIDLNVTVDGRILAEDTDWFSFGVEKGQVIHAEAEGVRLGLYDLDLQLEVFNPKGQLILRSDDTSLGKADPICSFTAKQTGTYKLSMRDVAYRGSSYGAYRLHVGTFPRPIGILPAGGLPGEMVSAQLLGGGTPANCEVRLPDQKGLHDIFLKIDGAYCPSPIRVYVDNRNHIVEDATTEPAPIAPCAFYGVIAKPSEEDRFAFRASKGKRLQIRALAKLLRSSLDPLLIIRDAKGKSLASNDDSLGLDCRVRFTPPADGVYFACVMDHLRTGSETHFYCLEVGSIAATATTSEVVPGRRSEDLGVTIPRGRRNATMIRVTGANPRSKILLTYENLPKGVNASSLQVPSNGLVPLILTAESKADLVNSLAIPTAKTGKEERPLAIKHRHAFPTLRIRNNQAYENYVLDTLPVVVTETVPFDIKVQQPSVPIVRSGSLKLQTTLTRVGDYRGTITIRALSLPAGMSASTVRLTGEASEATISLNANSTASLGQWPIVFAASAQIGGITQTISSQLLVITIAEPWITAKLPRARIEQGQSTKFEIELDHKRKFDGKVTATLGRIPKGVTYSIPEITSELDKLPIMLVAAPTARIGRHRSIYITLKIATADGVITHSAGGGEIRVDKPIPKAISTTGTTTSGQR